MFLGILFFILLIFLIDIITLYELKRIFNLSSKPKLKRIITISFWLFTILFCLTALVFILIEKNSTKPDFIVYRSFFNLVGIFLLIYFPKLLFVIFVDIEFIFRCLIFLVKKILKLTSKNNEISLCEESGAICPLTVFQKLPGIKFLGIIGLVLSIIFSFFILKGIIFGKTDFKTEHVTIYFKNLPESFDGFKIGQLSDMHLGSFSNPSDVRKGIDQLMIEKPDIIVFTGDLINNLSEEAIIMLPELKRMHAPYGMYSILGNHDVGDYRRWKTIEEKTADYNSLIKVQKDAGFNLLIDQNFIIKKDNDSIAIIGINSWGIPPFKQYGNFKKASKGVENISFKILLSHNPTQWDAEVQGKNNADITLAGHTHAMQLGINFCGIFWSPGAWIYKHDAGLYNYGSQYLYVNRGFGFLGFPGRIGMTPEITIIELKKTP
ncbi:MAG: metallophosphoesterase [Bacteroidetes bacterium]|nr:metallophosphoesterase [Bacteroidota bacterium]